MQALKKQLKYLFQSTNTLHLLDQLNFRLARFKHRDKNRQFRKQHPDFTLPSDYFLYETYKLDYAQYKEDGFCSAGEINDWTSKYLPQTKSILEWGCGVSRIIRHFDSFVNKDSRLFACDINGEMIAWNKKNIPAVDFSQIDYHPPMQYAEHSFDLIYAISVFTHIEAQYQEDWLKEIARVLKTNGVFLFTTHGELFLDKLTSGQLNTLRREGAYTISYKKRGHRMMATFNDAGAFRRLLENNFEVLEFHNGAADQSKGGGQDLWIVRKKG